MVKVIKRTIVFLLAGMVVTVPIVTQDAYAQDNKFKPVELIGSAEPIKKLDDKGVPYIDLESFDVVFDKFITQSEDTTLSYEDIKNNFKNEDSYITGLRFLDMRIYNQPSKVDETDAYEKKIYLTDTEGITTTEGNLIFEGNEATVQSMVVDGGSDFKLTLPDEVNCEYGYGWFQFGEMEEEFTKTVNGEKIEYYTNMFVSIAVAGEKNVQLTKMNEGKEGIYICFELDAQKRPVKMVSAYNVCLRTDLVVEAVDSEVIAFLGDAVTLSVSVKTSKEDLDCYWYKKDTDGVWKYIANNTTKLVIDEVKMSDFGTYLFTISDDYVAKQVVIDLKRDSADKDPVVANLTKVTTQARGTYAIKISWNKADNATGYVVYKAVKGRWQRVAVTAKNSYVYTSLNPGTSYAFAVKPYANYYGKIIYAKTHKSVASFTKPVKPEDIYSITRGYTAIKIGWSKCTGATGYVVYQLVNGRYVRLGTSNTNVAIVKNLRRGTRYQFAVKSYKRVGNEIVYSDGYIALSTPTKN